MAEDSWVDSAATHILCRICFDGPDCGELIDPCRCSGTQAFVHAACLLRWRRLQVFQNKLSAAAQCEVCGQKYASGLELPKKSVTACIFEFAHTFMETVAGLIVYFVSSPFSLCTPSVLALVGLPLVGLGVLRATIVLIVAFPLVILFLYSNGFKLSVLGMAGHYRLGITSFGAPVDGLQRGMLLVSVGALGTFERTVLYVIEHDDTSTLAVILNKPERKRSYKNEGRLAMSFRCGGPLEQGLCCIHNISGVPGAVRLLHDHSVFLTRNLSNNMEAFRDIDQEKASIVVLQGFASWGPHQLEGEVRRGAWGWIKAEHVRPEDVLEMDHAALAGTWERLVNKPCLQIFEG